jgi:hypothetical protein
MPVNFLSDEQRRNYGCFTGVPSPHDLTRYFHLDDTDHALIAKKRGEHNRLGFAAQLATVRYLGTFLDDPLAVPTPVLHTLAKQLRIEAIADTLDYRTGEQRWEYAIEIRAAYGYVEITEPGLAFALPAGYTRCVGRHGQAKCIVRAGDCMAGYAQGAAARL